MTILMKNQKKTKSKMKYTHKNDIHIIYNTATVGKFNHTGRPKKLSYFVFFLSYHINRERKVHQQIKLLKYLQQFLMEVTEPG